MGASISVRHLNDLVACDAPEALAPEEGSLATDPDELNAAQDVAEADDEAGRVVEVGICRAGVKPEMVEDRKEQRRVHVEADRNERPRDVCSRVDLSAPLTRNGAWTKPVVRGIRDGKRGKRPTDKDVAPSVGYVWSVVVIHSWQTTAKSGSLRKARQSGTT